MRTSASPSPSLLHKGAPACRGHGPARSVWARENRCADPASRVSFRGPPIIRAGLRGPPEFMILGSARNPGLPLALVILLLQCCTDGLVHLRERSGLLGRDA